MDELKLSGNCLKGSRPLISFDSNFDASPVMQVLKEMLTHTFAVPRTSRKIKPFIDHVMSFSVIDDKIWVRNYQIIQADPVAESKKSLVEIGPRCVLELIRLFDGSFGGSTLYENESFVTPNELRRAAKDRMHDKYRKRLEKKTDKEGRDTMMPEDVLEGIFQ